MELSIKVGMKFRKKKEQHLLWERQWEGPEAPFWSSTRRILAAPHQPSFQPASNASSQRENKNTKKIRKRKKQRR
jgi:hypothetical protein